MSIDYWPLWRTNSQNKSELIQYKVNGTDKKWVVRTGFEPETRYSPELPPYPWSAEKRLNKFPFSLEKKVIEYYKVKLGRSYGQHLLQLLPSH